MEVVPSQIHQWMADRQERYWSRAQSFSIPAAVLQEQSAASSMQYGSLGTAEHASHCSRTLWAGEAQRAGETRAQAGMRHTVRDAFKSSTPCRAQDSRLPEIHKRELHMPCRLRDRTWEDAHPTDH